MAKPLFSVIIPTLNEEKFLPNLLTSLAKQSDKSFEVIVVDGSSKDKTVTVAKSFSRKLSSLQVLVSKTASLPLQRNLGAKAARGEWFVFVDADSILMPYFIDRLRVYIGTHAPTVCTTWVQPDSLETHDAIFSLLANIFLETTVLFHRPIAPGPLTIIHKTWFDKVGGYDTSHSYNEDVDFGLRLSKAGAVVSLIRESLYIWSMRRLRREGKIKVIQQMVISSLPVLIFKRPLKYLPGYIMGGQLYGKKKPKRSVLKTYERKFKSLMKELFA